MVDLGKYKMWMERLRAILGWAQFAFVAYLFLMQRPMGLDPWLFVAIGVVASVLYLFIDIKFIYPAELNYSFRKNQQYMDDMEKMNKKLDAVIKHLDIEVEGVE